MTSYLYRNFEEILGSLLLGVVCLLAVVKIASRYIYALGKNPVTELIGGASSWSVEVCTYVFIWMVFVGASLAYKRHQHFAIEILVDRFNPTWSRYFRMLNTCLVILFAMVVIWYGMIQAWRGFAVVTPALEMPRTIPYAAVPFGGVLILIRSMESLVRDIRKREQDSDPEGEEKA